MSVLIHSYGKVSGDMHKIIDEREQICYNKRQNKGVAGGMEMEYKAVIFDFNGTMLADTLFQLRAWNTVLAAHGDQPLTELRYRQELCGRSSRETVFAVWGRELPKQQVQQLCDEKKRRYQQLCLQDSDNFRLVDGLEEFLDRLKASGTPFTIATSSSPYSVDFYFENLELGRWFERERILCQDRIVRGKPAPDIYVAAAKELSIAPADCLVFEDANNGIRAANRAGIGSVIVIDPEQCFQPEPDLRYDAVYPNFRELPL